MIYLDNASSTKIDQMVFAEMLHHYILLARKLAKPWKQQGNR